MGAMVVLGRPSWDMQRKLDKGLRFKLTDLLMGTSSN